MKLRGSVLWPCIDIGVGVGLCLLLLAAIGFLQPGGQDSYAQAATLDEELPPAEDPNPGASTSISRADLKIANVHQLIALEELFHPPDASTVAAADGQLAPEPYLLADYAAQCQAYMGTVPEFSCTDLQNPNILMTQTTIVTVDSTKDICPKLGVDEECKISGTVEGRLKPMDAPAGTDVTILFSCRKYDLETPADHFDDIAVIQHDKNTGNTCWFQSPTVFDFTRDGKPHTDQAGYVVYKDWAGAFVPSPMSYGAHNFWIHPYHPNEVIRADYVGDMRAGRRGSVANQDCQRCHDNDPFIWTSYLTNTHKIDSASPPTGWTDFGGPYVSNFLGVFSADGIHRGQAARFLLANDNPCSLCHTTGFGENTMSGQDRRSPNGAGKGVVNLLDLIKTVEENDNTGKIAWMPPIAGYEPLSETLKSRLHDCAVGRPQPGDTCTRSLPDPQIRPNLTLQSATLPTNLTAGHLVQYLVHVRNQGVFTAAHTAQGIQIVDTLPAGITAHQLPDNCTQNQAGSMVTCTVPELINGAAYSFTIVARVSPTIAVSSVTNQIALTTPDTDDNIATIQARHVHHVRRAADLSLSQSTQMVLLPASTPPSFQLTYRLTISNSGPAVAANVVLTQALPAGAGYRGDLSSERCTLVGGSVRCLLGNLHDGRSSTVKVIVDIPVNSGLFFTNQATVATDSFDPDGGNNVWADVVFERAAVRQHFLPLITRPGPRGPDLVVSAIRVTPATVEVVIQNIGDELLPADAPFWVDLYINPGSAPTGVNQTVQALKSDGLVWGVISPTLQLAPGESYTLRVGDSHYRRDGSSIPPLIQAGSVIYVQVDSANADSNAGGVREAHEIHGGGYNNIASIKLNESISTQDWSLN